MPCLSLSPRHCLAPPPAYRLSRKTAFASKRSQNVLPINFTQNQIKFVKRKTTWYVCLYPLPLPLPLSSSLSPFVPALTLAGWLRTLFLPREWPWQGSQLSQELQQLLTGVCRQGTKKGKGSGGEAKLCVCPPNNNENRWAIDTAQGKDEGQGNRSSLAVEPGEQQVLNVYCFNLQ